MAGLLAVWMLVGGASPVLACPFCGAISSTLTQDLEFTDAAALGVCVLPASSEDPAAVPMHRFKVTRILKGDAVSRIGVEVLLPAAEAFQVGDVALMVAVSEEDLWEWGAVGPLSPAAAEHVEKLIELPKSGKERMRYFLGLLYADDKVLADDAFNEFALASVEEMATVKPFLDREEVIRIVSDPATKLEVRRLHWTLLSICGRPEDVRVPEQAIAQRLAEEQDSVGFDSALSCALVLGGVPALEKIEQRILKRPDARYSDIHSAVLAIRVHGTEFKQIPRQRLVESLRLVLDKPEVADLVIPDLARWEDWTQIDKLVRLFAAPEPLSQYLKVPVVRYLQACPLPEAEAALEKCRQIDPESVRRAQIMFPRRKPAGSEKPAGA